MLDSVSIPMVPVDSRSRSNSLDSGDSLNGSLQTFGSESLSSSSTTSQGFFSCRTVKTITQVGAVIGAVAGIGLLVYFGFFNTNSDNPSTNTTTINPEEVVNKIFQERGAVGNFGPSNTLTAKPGSYFHGVGGRSDPYPDNS